MECPKIQRSSKRKRTRHDILNPFCPSLSVQVDTRSVAPQALTDSILYQHPGANQQQDHEDQKPGPVPFSIDKKLRTYARKRRKRIQDDNDSRDFSEEMSPSESTPVGKRRKKSNVLRINSPVEEADARPQPSGQRKRALADRLLQAAVLSGVEPADSLIEPDPNAPAPTRKPLQFKIPDYLHDTPESKLKRRPSWNLVDPHRTSSIRTASFDSSKERKLSRGNSILKSLTEWPTRTLPHPSKKRTREELRKEGIVIPKAKCNTNTGFGSRRPLVLVPIEKSELLHQRSVRRMSRPSPQVNSNEVDDSTFAGPRSLSFVNASTKTMSVTDRSIQQPTPTQSSPYMASAQLSPSPPHTKSNLGHVSECATDTPIVANDVRLQVPIDFAPCSTPPVPAAPCASTLELAPYPHLATDVPSDNSQITKNFHMSPHPDQTAGVASQSTSNKPAKPLSSFFDEFLETIRAANSAKKSAAPSNPQRRSLHPIRARRTPKMTDVPQLNGPTAEGQSLTRHDDCNDTFEDWSSGGLFDTDYNETFEQENKHARLPSPDITTKVFASLLNGVLTIEIELSVWRGFLEMIRPSLLKLLASIFNLTGSFGCSSHVCLSASCRVISFHLRAETFLSSRKFTIDIPLT
ncbi:hypothetical protein F5878DRAFT_712267 [Lentinula raphanica]|uniref:Uncharacterized protein n=1 Tax=Lentinula raphanica TaxID=153919 RepID=A0AA38P2T9_9AGAR|nr:hypothetical protein F5878DRAFT_712267 [Lentinula raphanica]